MRRSLVTALVLIACSFGGEVLAQSSDGTNGSGEAPTLILPGLLTNPITSGLDPDGYGATGAPMETEIQDAPSEAPYSVEGEETLDPETN
jgi:hypothetical protein